MTLKEALALVEKYPKFESLITDDGVLSVDLHADWEQAQKMYEYFQTMVAYELQSGWIAKFNGLGIRWIQDLVGSYYWNMTIKKLTKHLDYCVFEEQLKEQFKLYKK